jgi:hypothetical protein
MNKIVLTFSFIGFLFLNSFAQNQTIKGNVIDKESQVTLPGVVVTLKTDPPSKTLTDVNGNYKLENIAPGRYDLHLKYLGYKELLIPNVIVTSGKEVVLDFSMEELINEVNEVVVTGSKKHETINELTTVSARSFSTEEVNRFAGGRSDPSRMAANFAGVNANNDARNDIVIRGNSPSGVLWRIEGLNVPNPNHFATMGNTGGPVSAINTNLLKNSDFFTSAFPSEYGNANAGVFDLGFRNGNSDKREHLLQFGLITGLEAMTEGPIKKGNGSSYLISYRHAFTGIAQKMGFNIGTTATPFFQDLSFKINSGTTKWGKFSLFGINGNSQVNFRHDNPDTNDLFAIPNRDSYFTSKIRVIGLNHFIRINEKSYLKTIIGINSTGSHYDEDSVNSVTKEITPVIKNYTEQIRYVINTSYNLKVNAKTFIKIGIVEELLGLNLFYKTRNFSPNWIQIWDTKDQTSLFQSYAHLKHSFTDKLTLNLGLHTQHLALNKSNAFEPRAGLKYQANGKNTFSFGYGFHSQMQPLDIYFFRDLNLKQSNLDLDFTKSHHYVIGYDLLPFPNWRLKSEVYYQQILNAPVTELPSSYSVLNVGATFNPNEVGNLVNKGEGKNYGIELTLEKFFSHGYYGLFSSSLYSSTYKGSDGVERNTAFNTNFVYNVLIGKEFKIGKEHQNTFSIDVKFTHVGGRYFTPINLEASQTEKRQVEFTDKAFSERNPEFLRLDVKFGIVLNSKKWKVSNALYLDINNVTNHQNVFAQRYNVVTNTINTAYQIGFFPNFVYRFQF